jgi:hypothetical protein
MEKKVRTNKIRKIYVYEIQCEMKKLIMMFFLILNKKIRINIIILWNNTPIKT